jgi:hypothetical protein
MALIYIYLLSARSISPCQRTPKRKDWLKTEARAENLISWFRKHVRDPDSHTMLLQILILYLDEASSQSPQSS